MAGRDTASQDTEIGLCEADGAATSCIETFATRINSADTPFPAIFLLLTVTTQPPFPFGSERWDHWMDVPRFMIVLAEESVLTTQFGHEYMDYCRKVNRFFPQVSRP